jgi:hypothetical protein
MHAIALRAVMRRRDDNAGCYHGILRFTILLADGVAADE